MSSGCKSSVVCVDSRIPVRATYSNLYKWPESDAEFVRLVAGGGIRGGSARHGGSDTTVRRKWTPAPQVVDSFSCRQMYLRSYKFSRKETMPEKTRRCLAKVKEKAALFGRDSESDAGTISSYLSGKGSERRMTTTTKKKKKVEKKKKKGCAAAVRKLKDATCSVFDSIFSRMLSCTGSVEVVDGHGFAPPASTSSTATGHHERGCRASYSL